MNTDQLTVLRAKVQVQVQVHWIGLNYHWMVHWIVKYHCKIYHFRSQSKGVRKYKFKIKKENERCLEYLVEDHDPEEENIKFTIPLAFQVRRCVLQSQES